MLLDYWNNNSNSKENNGSSIFVNVEEREEDEEASLTLTNDTYRIKKLAQHFLTCVRACLIG
jgi:hypothetical protein